MDDDFHIHSRIFLGAMISVSIMMLFTIICSMRSMNITPTCKVYGYPTGFITLDFKSYCIKRVDQTEVVVRLRDIK